MTHNEPTKIKSIVNPDRQLKKSRATKLLETFYNHIEIIPQQDQLPLIDLKTPIDFTAHNQNLTLDQQLLWSLSSALFENRLAEWLRALVAPGMVHGVDKFKRQHAHDAFATVFGFLAYGEREKASDEAKRLGDFNLSMFIVHTNSKDLSTTLGRHLGLLKDSVEWQNYSVFRKKCWYLISGQLGCVERDLRVTEDVSWQCVVAMYLWYGTLDSLEAYNRVINPVDSLSLDAYKGTALPEVECLWYQLLQLWMGDASEAHLDDWTTDFLWMLSLYRPQILPENKYILRWCDELENLDMTEWSLFVALFLKNTQQEKVRYLLRNGEWEDQEMLIQKFHIPKKWIYVAKSLRAHDDWDFELEYECLLEGNLLKEAMMALLNFLLPNHFYRTLTALRTSLTYLLEYPDQERDDIQLLKKAYLCLISNDSEEKEELIKGLEEYAILLQAYPNAHKLILSLIDAIKD